MRIFFEFEGNNYNSEANNSFLLKIRVFVPIF
jgi:hypothetical protein